MQKFLFICLVFFSCKSFSQDSLSYKKYVDSVLLSRTNIPVKKIKAKDGPLRLRYFFNKQSKELSLIEVVEKFKDSLWIYNYQFVNGQLAMMNKYNNHPLGDKLRQNAFYYLKNYTVIYSEENKTKFLNLAREIKRAEELKLKAPNYYVNKIQGSLNSAQQKH